MEINAKLHKQIFFSEGNQYFIGSFFIEKKDRDKMPKEITRNSFVATGNVGMLSSAKNYILEGQWIKEEKYGYQFQITSLKESMPRNEGKIFKYFIDEMSIPITRRQVTHMLEEIGPNFFESILNDFSLLNNFKFLDEELIEEITFKLKSNHLKSTLFNKFSVAGFNLYEFNIFLKDFFYKNGDEIDNLNNAIKNTPYNLIEFTFMTVDRIDEIIKSFNFEHNNNDRKIAIVYELLENKSSSTSNTCFELAEFFVEHKQKINLGAEEFVKEIKLGNLKELIKIFNRRWISTMKNYENEIQILSRIQSLSKTKQNKIDNININPKLDKQQQEAIVNSLKKPFTIISGAPGTGKTLVISEILNNLINNGLYGKNEISVLTPTGRASQKINSTFENNNIPKSKTIHSTLAWENLSSFFYNEDNPLDFKVIIIDEISMVDNIIFGKILAANPKIEKIILIGDVNQLPSIDPGHLLYDLSKLYSESYMELKTNYRQKSGKQIMNLAKDIQQQRIDMNFDDYEGIEFIEINSKNREEELKSLFKKLNLKDSLEKRETSIQMLSTTRKGILGSNFINKNIQNIMMGQKKALYETTNNNFYIDDKIINSINNSSKDITNGEIGFINNKTPEGHIETILENKEVSFSLKEAKVHLELGYCITTHKSQGSEFDIVIFFADKTGTGILTNHLFYTAITRAKKKLIIVGDLNLIKKSIYKSNAGNIKTIMSCI